MFRNKNATVLIASLALANLLALGMWLYFKQRFDFVHPYFFFGLFALPLLSGWYFWKEKTLVPGVTISSIDHFDQESFLSYFRHVAFAMRMIIVALLIAALARPQTNSSWENINKEGIDIVVAMDVSASMLSKDFNPNRLGAAKDIGINFIKSRPNDRIGLVLFEGESFTQCPITSDHSVLIKLFKEAKTGLLDGGTAIGMGLATAVDRLRNSKALSKVVILLTDGENNSGSISPKTAGELAKEFGVRVYCIGVGTRGKALTPVAVYPDGSYKYEYQEVKVDEATLRSIAEMTGGKYFRATDNRSLSHIYQEIDQLEKTKFNVTRYHHKTDRYLWFALVAAALLGIEILIRQILLRTSP